MLLLVAGLLLGAIAVGLWHLTRNSRKQWKVLARIGAVALVCISALVLLLFLFSGAMCGRYDFAPVSSPDGGLVAQVSEEDCGAVDSFHSSVQLWRLIRRNEQSSGCPFQNAPAHGGPDEDREQPQQNRGQIEHKRRHRGSVPCTAVNRSVVG